MKKVFILISFMALFMTMSIGSVAQTTYIFANYPAGVQYAENEEHILDSDVTLYTTKCHFTTQLRIYSSATNDGYFVSNQLPNYIQSLSFNLGYKVDNLNIYGSNDGNNWALVGTIAVTGTNYNDYTLDFGENNYRYFKGDVAGTQQLRAASMTINYKTGANTVVAPSFAPEGGVYSVAQNVTLSSTTTGANIYYTTDGNTPDSTSTLYSAPIVVSSNTTIKAVAYKTGMTHSSVITETYIFPIGVSNIAALRAGATDGTVYQLNGEAILTFQTTQNGTKALQDNSGAIIVFDSQSKITTSYNLYDGITGLTGTLTLYGQMLEFVPVGDPGAATSTNNIISPAISTLDALTTAQEGKLVKLNNITISDITTGGNGLFQSSKNYTITDENNHSGILRTNYYSVDYIGETIPTTPQNITAIVTQYNGTIQLVARSLSDFENAGSGPILNVNPANINNFSYIVNNGPSETKVINLLGSNIIGDLTVASSANFEISLTDVPDFAAANTITLSAVDGNVSENIYVRMISNLSEGEYTGSIDINGDSLSTASVTLEGTVYVNLTNTWKRVSNIIDLANGSRVMIASRNLTTDATSYSVMAAKTFGKPVGTICNTIMYDGNEIIPMEISNVDTSYAWTINTNDGLHFSFTNYLNDAIGYLSGTNFATDTNYIWTVEYDTAISVAMIPSYTGFKVINGAVTGRGMAMNTSFNFGAYATSNINNTSNAAYYNFFVDFFVETTTNIDTNIVAMPSFTPASGIYTDSVNVTINCATEGAAIYYTTNGNTPDSSATLYVAPINVTQDMTIKAIAYKQGMTTSGIASASYIINAPILVNNIAALSQGLTDGSIYKLNNEAIVTFDITASNKHYIYIEDTTGAILIYDNSLIIPTLNTYDGLSQISGTISQYNGMTQLIPTSVPTISSTGNTFTPKAITVADLATIGEAELVTINNVSIADVSNGNGNFQASKSYTISDETGNGVLRTQYNTADYIGTTLPVIPQNITGVIVKYNTTMQFVPRSLNDFENVIIPYLSTTPVAINGLSYTESNGPSTAEAITINGFNLTNDVTVLASTGFEIATSATGTFASTLNLAQNAGSISTDIYVRLAAGLSIGAHTGTLTISSTGADNFVVELNATVTDPNVVTTIENFDNLGIGTGSNYINGSFTGNGGITWNYTQCRNDIALDGASIMLGRNRTPQANLKSGFINGGIAIINFDYMQAFSSNVALNVVINDSVYATVTSNNEVNVVKNSGDIAIYVAGPFTIQFISNSNTDGQVCIDNISWTSYNDGTLYTDAPTFTPAGGQYESFVDVSLSCGTDGATIKYSTTSENGPWTVYSTPIHLVQTSSVWAFAEKADYVTSAVVENTYNIISVTEVANIAQLRAGSEGVFYKVSGQVVITEQSSYRNVKYVQDNTGAIIIDDNDHVITTSYNLYDGITNLSGTLTTYNGMLQLIPTADPGVATSTNNVVTPEIVSLSQIDESYQAKLVTIENVSFGQSGLFEASTNYNITSEGTSGVVRTQYSDANYIGSSIPTVVVNVTAVVLQYNQTIQLVPRLLSDFAIPDAINENANMLTRVWNTDNAIMIENNTQNMLNMIVYNLLGQPIMEQNIGAGINRIAHNLTQGVYIVRINENTTKIVVK